MNYSLQSTAETAEAGDFVTECIAGDYYPAYIVKRTAHTITVGTARVIRASGTAYREGAETGTFALEPVEGGATHIYRQAKDGSYRYAKSFRLHFGEVIDRKDPAF